MDITDSSLVESKKLNPKQTLELLKQTYLKPRAIITEHVRYYCRNIPYHPVHIY